MNIRRVITGCLLALCLTTALAQKVTVKAKEETLSSVVRRLGADVSYDNALLSKYRVTVNRTFSSPQEALVYLLSGKPLEVRKVSGVFIITQKKEPEKPKQKTKKQEPKPREAAPEQTLNLSVSLKEIMITAKSHSPTLQTDSTGSSTQFNSYAARAMPGGADNMVFNVLRMMPGIRASGEPADELYVWGSSPGESRMTLDGIPLLNMQSYNANISYINPYMVDEVRYKRGILSADEGSQTGAKVEVVSSDGMISKPEVKALLGTMSANVFGAFPVSKRCLVTVAYRHTLDDWFGGTTFDAYRKREDRPREGNAQGSESSGRGSGVNPTPVSDSGQGKTSDTGTGAGAALDTTSSSTITPKYRFQDVNVHVAGMAGRDLAYRVTLYGAKDYLKYESSDTLASYGDQTSYQGGASAEVVKSWSQGHRTQWLSYVSGLRSTQNSGGGKDASTVRPENMERVTQYGLKCEHTGIGSIGGLSVGAEWITYRVHSERLTCTLSQPSLFASERFTMGPLYAEAGLRTDLMSHGVEWQPRAMARLRLFKYVSLTSAWGIYHQYLVKDPFAVEEGQYRFGWDINPYLKSYNTVAGIAYDRGGLNVSVEAYLKQIHDAVWVVGNQLGRYNFHLRGLDLSSKYNGRHCLLFASWSMSKDPRQTDGVSHELKAGGILRFYPFIISANYVYGSGYNSMLLPQSSFAQHNAAQSVNNHSIYSRMDVSASYEKRFKYFGLTAGVSFINIFDTSNRKYVTTWMPRDDTSSISNQASRFTPILFIEIKM